jgi:hypothetical protein
LEDVKPSLDSSGKSHLEVRWRGEYSFFGILFFFEGIYFPYLFHPTRTQIITRLHFALLMFLMWDCLRDETIYRIVQQLNTVLITWHRSQTNNQCLLCFFT